ncbi:MAG: polymer-forming cytoskeletal protein [Candidatus Ancaeobacter aquaticus]|nr:polymer-forming cytoskeletal protein [Candidatus Ancaeobacter aquaticus]
MSSLLRKFTTDIGDNKGRNGEDTYSPPRRDFSPSQSSGRVENKTNLCSDVEFKGTLIFKDFLRLDGKFEGEISSPGTLIIGSNGTIKADINVGNVIAEGKVYGNITAQDKIELRGNAQLFGDIKASRIVITEGVVFVGKCDVNPNNSVEDSAPEEHVSEEPLVSSNQSTSDLLNT